MTLQWSALIGNLGRVGGRSAGLVSLFFHCLTLPFPNTLAIKIYDFPSIFSFSLHSMASKSWLSIGIVSIFAWISFAFLSVNRKYLNMTTCFLCGWKKGVAQVKLDFSCPALVSWAKATATCAWFDQSKCAGRLAVDDQLPVHLTLCTFFSFACFRIRSLALAFLSFCLLCF